MIRRSKASAFSNIALVKYWGKCAPGNGPATPSISLGLAELVTETEVSALVRGSDRVSINGRPADAVSRRRITGYLDHWREQGLISGTFRIATYNSFPTASGLASSASGYAALAAALSAFSKRRISERELSKLARQGSGSAARSIPGGLAALPAGRDPAARRLASPDEVPWGMVVAVVRSGMKEMSSREGMELSRQTSPYYRSWVAQARRDYRDVMDALSTWDLPAVGDIMERNALAMHACMMATRPPLVYLEAATLDLLRAVRVWRTRGLDVYATMDAGPNVALLTHRKNLARVARLAAKEHAVRSVVKSLPGGPAAVLECR